MSVDILNENLEFDVTTDKGCMETYTYICNMYLHHEEKIHDVMIEEGLFEDMNANWGNIDGSHIYLGTEGYLGVSENVVKLLPGRINKGIEEYYGRLKQIAEIIQGMNLIKGNDTLDTNITSEVDEGTDKINKILGHNNIEEQILFYANKSLEDFKSSLGVFLETGNTANMMYGVFYKLHFLEKPFSFYNNPKKKIDWWIDEGFPIPDDEHFNLMINRVVVQLFTDFGNKISSLKAENILLESNRINYERLISELKTVFEEYGKDFRKINDEYKNKSQ